MIINILSSRIHINIKFVVHLSLRLMSGRTSFCFIGKDKQDQFFLTVEDNTIAFIIVSENGSSNVNVNTGDTYVKVGFFSGQTYLHFALYV